MPELEYSYHLGSLQFIYKNLHDKFSLYQILLLTSFSGELLFLGLF